MEIMILSVLAFPFVQFGLSWWVNISSLGCLLLFFVTRRNGKKLFYKFDVATSLIVFSMITVYVWQDFGDLHSFLRIAREALVFFLLFYFNQRSQVIFSTKSVNYLDRVLLGVVFIEFALVLCQFIFLRHGVWVGPKAGWLAGRGNLIPTALDLQYSKLRPSGTFSEPSYLGIFCLSVLLLVGVEPLENFIKKTAYSLSLVTIIFSQSKSALLFGVCIFLSQRMHSRKIAIKEMQTFALPLILFSILPFWGLVRRTLESSRGSISIQNRIFDPLAYSFNFVLKHPLGISFYKRIFGFADSNTGLSWEAISHNSFFNLIFSYGVVGLFISIRFLKLSKSDLILSVYVVALLLQNGGFLDFDKLFLLTVVVAIYRNRLTILNSRRGAL